MKITVEDTKKTDIRRLIFYIAIIVICLISIIVAIVLQNVQLEEKSSNNNNNKELEQIKTEEIEEYKEKFNNIFQNKVNYLENNSYKITKNEPEEEIIYVGYENKETKINDYQLDVNIPYINIKDDKIEEFNEEIVEIFEKKAKSILNNRNENVIYTVNYSAYVQNNILSLVIRSTLKDGDNPQRDIVQTYNYDLTNHKEYVMQEFLEAKGITKKQANEEIKKEITNVQRTVSELKILGYNVFERDIDSDIYSIDNVTEYFIGENNALYIIFAYGNENITSEMDIVIM